jgi:subtilisin family serine protease
MRRMKKSASKMSFVVLAILLLVASVIPIALASPANPFRRMANTESGHTTWDSDIINIEAVNETGDEIYVAVLDTGLAPNWRDYFPKDRILTKLGKGFIQPLSFEWVEDVLYARTGAPVYESTFIGSTSTTHGTHVVSTIIGYYYDTFYDSIAGYPLPPIIVRGIAPNVNIIPIKVLADYTIPPNPEYDLPEEVANFGTSAMVAAGINYVTDLAIAGYSPMIITMSLGGPDLDVMEQTAIDRAIANGVIVVAAAGNEGEDGMSYPGAYPPVISVGACGWAGEWLHPDDGSFFRLWWLQSDYYDYTDILDPTPPDEVYIPSWSSRELAGQELDVLAPGSWVRGPYPGFPGYAHMPWWSQGIGHIVGNNPGTFYYVGGTSMATPHVAGVAALMLEKNPTLNQGQIETILRSTALSIPVGSASVYDVFEGAFVTISWDDDATGEGLIQANEAVEAVTPP